MLSLECKGVPRTALPKLADQLRAFGAVVTFHDETHGELKHPSGVIEFEHRDDVLYLADHPTCRTFPAIDADRWDAPVGPGDRGGNGMNEDGLPQPVRDLKVSQQALDRWFFLKYVPKMQGQQFRSSENPDEVPFSPRWPQNLLRTQTL